MAHKYSYILLNHLPTSHILIRKLPWCVSTKYYTVPCSTTNPCHDLFMCAQLPFRSDSAESCTTHEGNKSHQTQLHDLSVIPRQHCLKTDDDAYCFWNCFSQATLHVHFHAAQNMLNYHTAATGTIASPAQAKKKCTHVIATSSQTKKCRVLI